MQFSLRSLFIAIGMIAIAMYLVVSAPIKAAIVFVVLFTGTVGALAGRKTFPQAAMLVGCATGIVFLYYVSEGLLITLRPVSLRAATVEEVREKYFCIEPMPEMTTRNVVIVEGTFEKDTWLTAELFLVRGGSIQGLNGFTVGRSPNRIGEAEWIGMEIGLAIADAKVNNGRVSQLGSSGHSRGSGSGGNRFVHNVSASTCQTFAGRMHRGQTRIVYVEGDVKAMVTPNMTVSQFAEANTGNYLVVTAGLAE